MDSFIYSFYSTKGAIGNQIKNSYAEQTYIGEKKHAQSRNRTSDTRIFSPLLYQLSYQLSYLGIVAGGGFEPPTFGL